MLRVGKSGAYMLCYIAEDAIEEVLGTSSENENGGGGEEEEVRNDHCKDQNQQIF